MGVCIPGTYQLFSLECTKEGGGSLRDRRASSSNAQRPFRFAYFPRNRSVFRIYTKKEGKSLAYFCLPFPTRVGDHPTGILFPNISEYQDCGKGQVRGRKVRQKKTFILAHQIDVVSLRCCTLPNELKSGPMPGKWKAFLIKLTYCMYVHSVLKPPPRGKMQLTACCQLRFLECPSLCQGEHILGKQHPTCSRPLSSHARFL